MSIAADPLTMEGRARSRSLLLFSTLALLIALLLPSWGSARILRLPERYRSELRFDASSRFRASLQNGWEAHTFLSRRVEQTISSNGEILVIAAFLDWSSEDGTLFFENNGLYGVDRSSRMNIPGFGDEDREGFFLVPPEPREAVLIWDTMFIGPREARYLGEERAEGLLLHRYEFTATGLDETEGYSFLPDVPAPYRTLTDGWGYLVVEPRTGVVVDYEEEGVSYFVDVATGERAGDFQRWLQIYTPETRAAQQQAARALLLRLDLVERWLPALFIGLALTSLIRYVRSPGAPA